MKLVVLAVTLLPALAHADALRVATATVIVDGPPGSDFDRPPSTQPERPAPPPQPEERYGIARRDAVVAGDHGIVTSTALTVPSGNAEVSIRVLAPFAALLSIAGGLSNSTELWADAGTSLGDSSDGVSTVGVGLKQVIARGRTWQLAINGSLRYLGDSGDAIAMGLVGGVATGCTDDTCNFMGSAGIQRIFTTDGGSDAPTTFYTFGLSAGGRHTRAMFEVIRVDRDSLMVAGIRFGNARLAFDVAVAMAAVDGDSVPLPLLSAIGRM